MQRGASAKPGGLSFCEAACYALRESTAVDHHDEQEGVSASLRRSSLPEFAIFSRNEKGRSMRPSWFGFAFREIISCAYYRSPEGQSAARTGCDVCAACARIFLLIQVCPLPLEKTLFPFLSTLVLRPVERVSVGWRERSSFPAFSDGRRHPLKSSC
jgi:hypothetical protein